MLLPHRVSWLMALACQFSLSAAALAQDHDESDGPQKFPADPAALNAFTEMIHAYRQRPALTIKSTVKVELKQGDVSSDSSQEVKAQFTFGPHHTAVLKLKGFTVYVSPPQEKDGDGTITAIHEGTKESYFSDTDDGSPYYALHTAFFDMPFPELAIELGEDKIEDLLTQFHPKAPWIQPTSVTVEEKAPPGEPADPPHAAAKIQRLKLTSPFEIVEIVIDPETKLIQSIDAQITGGSLVQNGHALTYHHTYEYQTYEKPLDESTFKFDPGARQRVDMMAALMPKPKLPEPGEMPQGALVGKPAPTFVLSGADGKAVDLHELRGRVVVLDFWASWCGPCMAALPMLHQVAKWASDQELPVTFLTINVWEIRDKSADNPDARVASAKNTWQKRNFKLPILMDFSDETAKSYGVMSIPTGIIIRSDGVVHAQHVGAGGDYVEDMKREIQEALKAVEPGAGDEAHE